MNTIEKNELLAEFMDIDTSPKEIDCKECRFFYQCNLIQCSLSDDELYKNPELFYNSDWNWLMEVVEKIENYNEFTNVLFAPQGCSIDCYTENRFSFSNDCDTKIEAVYNACVEFVKWYNEQKLIDILIK